MIKIEREYNRFKVNFVGTRSPIRCTEAELLNVVAHYYQLESHISRDCVVCRSLEKKIKKHLDKKENK